MSSYLTGTSCVDCSQSPTLPRKQEGRLVTDLPVMALTSLRVAGASSQGLYLLPSCSFGDFDHGTTEPAGYKDSLSFTEAPYRCGPVASAPSGNFFNMQIVPAPAL